MSETNTLGIFASTKPARLLFPKVDKAEPFKRNGKEVGDPKFSAGFMLDADNEDLAAIKAKALSVARAKWPGVDPKTIDWPWKSGDKLADKAKEKGKNGEYQRGKVVLTARSKFRPRLAGLENGALVDYETDAAIALAKPKFYFGAQVLYEVNFVAYEATREGERNGVNAYLNSVVTLNKGERLAGGPSAAETFKGYVGAATSEDPTTGSDDF
jgi:hypothetical protein